MISAISNFDEIKEKGGDFEKLPAGGYVVRITKVTPDKNSNGKEFLSIVFDIAEGQYKDFFKATDDAHEFLHSGRVYYNADALGMFKGFLKAIDDSNNTTFAADMKVKGLDETKLVGKVVGGIVGYEEYNSTRGDVKQRANWKFTKSAKAIREGKFNVPELKKLEPKAGAVQPTIPEGFEALNDADCPF